ncbi:MAG: 3-methyl-2-oxobutanoate hydroxymethyltransferase [Acidobacteria bacterium]|nr:3-methyl-2-oxobutanoate hydroxymethyltransferase [Acidobacteriota bacterium]
MNDGPAAPREALPAKVTVPQIAAAKGVRPLVMVTAYDAPSARAVDEGGADIILVGDSLAMVVLGYDDTLRVDVEDMVRHTAAVSRTRPRALVVADMPYLSYHTGTRDAVLAAGRLVREGGAEAVKLEGGRKRLEVIRALLDAEIPVMGHLGLTPQSLLAMGGYRVQARAVHEIETLLADAGALVEAGVFALVLEGVPSDVAAMVTQRVAVPTIGIGAGPTCDGQVLVYHDLLGIHPGPAPRFVRRFGDLHTPAVAGVRAFADEVRARTFPAMAESYRLPRETAEALGRRPRARRREG